MRRTYSSLDKQIFELFLLVNICCVVMDLLLNTQKHVLSRIVGASGEMVSRLLSQFVYICKSFSSGSLGLGL